jgi:rhodanese-related sulfurtransferase
MKIKYVFLTVFMLGATVSVAFASETKMLNAKDFSSYLRSFDYQERKDMKIKPEELKKLYLEGKVQIVDIRFPEEQALWGINFATSMPLNEIPDRLSDLDKDKIIVTVCPHYDRASIARHYLTLQGYNAKYLVGGLLKLAEELRGDDAREFFNEMNRK